MTGSNESIVFAVPKGRIAKELVPILDKAGIIPCDDFFDPNSRLLKFHTNQPNVSIIRVRSFDVATFVAYGGAHIGVAGSDVITEFDNRDLYVPLDLGIGKCRLSVAEPKDMARDDDISRWSHIKVATKYPNTTKKFFAERGIQAECIKLNGAMELAPMMGLCQRIVDLVSTGTTLRENGLVEIETISEVSSMLIVNRIAYKTINNPITKTIERFREIIHG
ncbi:MAG: ATP phosphoribosyltransferase [Rickettsiales bacterium]|nr:ATP phosphoribosyltransferase [Rickettsiales bacterium]